MKKENSGKEVLLDPELIRKLVVGIGEVSDITGVPTRKIRYWEEKGIITYEHNSEGETRKYNFFNIKKIIMIMELVEEGFTLDAAAVKVNKSIETFYKAFTELANKEDK